MFNKVFHALADIWRVFIYSTAEYQTAIAAVVFSANGVRQILKNHLHYAMGMRHNTCDFVALVHCHWPILASGFIQVISSVVYAAVFWAVDRVVDADEQYSVSFFRNHLFHFISFPDTYFSHEVGCWRIVILNELIIHWVVIVSANSFISSLYFIVSQILYNVYS